MSVIDARLPSFITSVLESTFRVFPDSVRVLFERSRFSTRPLSWLSWLVPADAVALLLSAEPVLAEPVEVSLFPVLAVPDVSDPVLPVLADPDVPELVLPDVLAPLLLSLPFAAVWLGVLPVSPA